MNIATLKKACMPPRIVYSAIQPSGGLHLGNYLGAVQKWVALQEKPDFMRHHQFFLGLADLHGLTSLTSAKNNNRLDYATVSVRMAAELLACNIDPSKGVILKRNSRVLHHSNLAWILSCLVPMSRLKNMTQYKAKMEKKHDAVGGLLYYPILQAADILLYKAEVVPVGQDQLQHLELARELAKKFNDMVGYPYFPLPRPSFEQLGEPRRLNGECVRIKSLSDPLKKMSKSDTNDFSRINLIDAPDVIQEKIRKALTDSQRNLSYDIINRPAISNLLSIFHALQKDASASTANDSEFEHMMSRICEPYNRMEYPVISFKKDLTDLLVNTLSPIKNRFDVFLRDPDAVLRLLKDGESKANQIASHNYDEILKFVKLS